MTLSNMSDSLVSLSIPLLTNNFNSPTSIPFTDSISTLVITNAHEAVSILGVEMHAVNNKMKEGIFRQL